MTSGKCRSSESLKLSFVFFMFMLLNAQASDSNSIEIQDPWIRAPAPFAQTLGGFMVVKSVQAVALVQAEAKGFDHVMLHHSINENGMHRMIHVEKIVIPPHDQIKFQHGSYHLMFVGKHKPTRPDDIIPVTLKFDNGTQTLVSFFVKKPG